VFSEYFGPASNFRSPGLKQQMLKDAKSPFRMTGTGLKFNIGLNFGGGPAALPLLCKYLDVSLSVSSPRTFFPLICSGAFSSNAEKRYPVGSLL